jgi:predicted MFS family arabinose efflux permease
VRTRPNIHRRAADGLQAAPAAPVELVPPPPKVAAWLGSISVFAVCFCYAGLTPIYPLVARDFRLSVDSFAIIVAAAPFAIMFVQLPVGFLYDRFGGRLFLMLGIGLMVAGYFLRSASTSIWPFALAQVLIGASWAIFFSTMLSVFMDHFASRGPTFVVGLLFAAATFGQVAGFVVLALLASVTDWRHITFVCAFLPLAVVPAVLWLGRYEQGHRRTGGGPRIGTFISFLRSPRIAILTLVAALATVAPNGVIYLLPFALRHQGVATAVTGGLLALVPVGAMVVAPVAGGLTDRYGAAWTVPILFAAGAIAAAAMAILPSVLLIIAACLIVGAVLNGVPVAVQTKAVAFAGHYGQAIGAGTATAGLRLGITLGATFGPVLAGFVYAHQGQQAATVIMGADMLIGLLLAIPVLGAASDPSASTVDGA